MEKRKKRVSEILSSWFVFVSLAVISMVVALSIPFEILPKIRNILMVGIFFYISFPVWFVWSARKILWEELDSWHKEDEQQRETIYRDTGRVAAQYLNLFVSVRGEKHPTSHGLLIKDYVGPGLRWLALQVQEAAELQAKAHTARAKEEKTDGSDDTEVAAADLAYKLSKEAFFRIRDGLASRELPEDLNWLHKVKSWKYALDLPYKVA